MSEIHAEGWREKIRAAFWRHRRVHLVLLVWAVCYLPGLGSVEIKGEEGRRILPGVTMLESGNYLVPHVGSEPYFRKPPLINWLVAASFKLTGVRNEWTARLPSALCILAVALAFVSLAAPSLGATGSFLAALIWLTFAGNLEKGRQIEIEALYVSLTALAFVCWMAAYRSGRTGLRLWLVPAIFLGLGILAKGPLPHLLFFYGPVIAILRRDGKLALLVTRAHFLALLITFGLFACWAVPAYLLSDSSHVAAVWGRQFKGRVTGQQFQFVSWVTAIPRSLVYLLPWLPFALFQVEMPAEERSSQRVLLAGMTVPFVLVCLLPEAVPRFSLPVLGPAAWWFSELLRHTPWRFPTWLGARTFDERWRRRAVATILVLTCLFMLVYAVVMGRHSQAREKIRKHARQIDLIVPANVPLYAVDPQYQPYLFYVHAPVHYVSSIDELPPETKFFLVQERDEAEGNTTKHWAPRRPQLVLHIKDYREREAVLYSVPSP
ncbi:MAG: glycosyltransferase family 39 protein [Verrucomicrobiota bacterium]